MDIVAMFSHGAIWNFMPLSIREQMLGDLLRPHGVNVALAGKTHFAPDLEAAEQTRGESTRTCPA